MFKGSRAETNEKKGSDNEEEDDCVPVPSFQTAFTDALMFADLNLNVESISQGMTEIT